MSKKANPATIGAFIVGGAVLVIAAIGFLASGSLFGSHTDVVSYFSEPVNGLSVGAPVKYRGIQLGEVSRIGLFEAQSGNDYAEVDFRLDHEKLIALGGDEANISAENIVRLVRDGLRSRLEVESIVTGVVYVTLEFKEDIGPPVFVNDNSPVPEIPTALSPMSELTESAGAVIARLGQIDVLSISDNLQALLATLNDRLAEVELDTLSENLEKASGEAAELLANPELDDVVVSLSYAVAEFRQTNRSIQELIEGLGPAAGRLDSVTHNMNQAMVSASAATSRTKEMLETDAAFRESLEGTLLETEAAMKSLRRLLDMLERNPRAFLTGKPENRK